MNPGAVRAWLRAVRAEWTKLRSLTSTPVLVAAMVAGTVALGALVVSPVDADDCAPALGCAVDIPRLSLVGVHVAQLLAAVLAVLAVSGEYSCGMARTTFTAMPGRLRVIAARAVVVTGVTLAAAAVAVLASVLVARVILAGNGVAPLSLSDGPTLRAAAGTVLYLGLISLLSLGVALLVRDAAVALTSVAGLLYLVPILAQFVPSAAEVMLRYGPMTAGLAVQNTIAVEPAVLGPWAGLGVLVVWSGTALAFGTARFALADTR